MPTVKYRHFAIASSSPSPVRSIRSALKLDGGSGAGGIGQMVDTVDKFALGTGYYFKTEPIARAFFLVYLFILHLWAFCLVLSHAHGTLEPSADVGPEELLKPDESGPP